MAAIALFRLEVFSIRARSCDGPSFLLRQRAFARASAAAERCRAGADTISVTKGFCLSPRQCADTTSSLAGSRRPI